MIVETLKQLLEGSSPSAVEVGKLSGLSPEDLAMFGRGWPTLPVERREAILRLAGELGENDVQLDFSDIFKVALTDPEAAVRAAAIDGLWEDDDWRTAERIATLLRQDPDETVRVAAALGLARFGDLAEEGTLHPHTARQVRESLLAAARDQNETLEVRRRAIEAAGVLSEPEVAGLIESAYAASEPKLRESAVYAMGRSLDDRWLPTVLELLESESPELRFEAARAAGHFGTERALVALINLLKDEDLEVRLAAVGALGEIGGEVARKALQRCAKSPEAAMRDAAAEALEEMDLDASPLSIAPFLNDNTPTV